jgi:hypothetical protein
MNESVKPRLRGRVFLLDFIQKNPIFATKDLKQHFIKSGRSPSYVSQLLPILTKQKQIRRTGRGTYQFIDHAESAIVPHVQPSAPSPAQTPEPDPISHLVELALQTGIQTQVCRQMMNGNHAFAAALQCLHVTGAIVGGAAQGMGGGK